MILQIYPLITLSALWSYCAGRDLSDDEERGIIGEQHIADRIVSLYNITKEDVLTYDMKSSGPYYPARNGLDGNINTQANTAYGGDNLTYWDVRLKRNFAITRVYAMGINYKDVNLTLNVSLDGKQSGLYRCDKMNGSWTYKLCNANSNKAKSALGDMVQLQKYGYGFYLKEAVIQAIPHIELAEPVKSASFLNRTSACWQTVLSWQVNDSCCSGAVYITIFKNLEVVNFAVNFTNTTSGETEIIVNECAKPLQTNSYIIQLNNDQMSKNISLNYTSPSIDHYLVTIDSYTVDVYNITTTGFEVTFPMPKTKSKLVPYLYSASLLHENAVDTRQHLACDDIRCRTKFEGLMFSTKYAVDIVSSTEFAGITFNTSSDQLDLTTLNCSDPEPVVFNTIKDLLKTKYDLDIKIKFTPGNSHCTNNNTYILYAESETAPTEVIICDSQLFYCNIPLDAGTAYNLTIETVNTLGYSVNSTMSYTTPTRAPSRPLDVRYRLTLNQTFISWSPPQKPRGVITNYLISYQYDYIPDGMNTSYSTVSDSLALQGNVTTWIFNNTQWGSGLQLKIKAKTNAWGSFTSPVKITIPYKDLPSPLTVNLPVLSYQENSKVSPNNQSSCVSVQYSLWWNDTHIVHPAYKIYTKMACSYNGSLPNDAIILWHNFTADAERIFCDLNPYWDHTCIFHIVNYYGAEIRPAQSVSWHATSQRVSSHAVVTQSITKLPDQSVTLIVVGVAVTVFVIATVLIALLIFRQRKRSIQMSEADSYFSLISSEQTSSLSGLS